jgi:hypothetical protein
LPRFALLDHKAFDRALQEEYGDVLIEDLWLPYFALSTNLSSRQPHVHRRGKLWQAVRASGSIPGILPPFFTADGDMLVDGAIMSNLPVQQMKELKTGPNVIVSFESSAPHKYDIDYDRIPGASELAVAWLNPFGRGRLPHVPSMLQVIAASMLAHGSQDIAVGDEDVLVCPQVSSAISFMDWSRHSELFSDAYDQTTQWIEERLRQNDTGLSGARPRVLSIGATLDTQSIQGFFITAIPCSIIASIWPFWVMRQKVGNPYDSTAPPVPSKLARTRCSACVPPPSADQTSLLAASSRSTIGSRISMPWPNVTTRAFGSTRVAITNPGTNLVCKAPISRTAAQTSSGCASVSISLRMDPMAVLLLAAFGHYATLAVLLSAVK